MNKNKLNAMVHRVSEKTGIIYNSILTYYFMEDILSMISKSNYKDKFIFKGGFLLSNIIGISSRSTVDMDFQLRNEKLSMDNIQNMFSEILKSENSEIYYSIDSIKPIIEQDLYGGFRVNIIAKFENLREFIPIDIATGDKITPNPINYEYESIFYNDKISIKAYTLETMIAEKLQTIYSKGFLNTRSKDYFDLYLIWNIKKELINKDILQTALLNTFSYRNTEFDINKISTLISQLENPMFINRWESYRTKNNFVGKLRFKEVLESILQLINFIK